ncbi:carboxyl transferase domain-containing protein [Aquihabitans sp. McL0605]|uniref:carboxyl transferase domain-containing protein n=1 Tax=Aquihabitans sp. McL0605 TaxID=3415671 RepID=UPI003CE7BF22
MLTGFIDEWDRDLRSGDPLGFPGYAARVDHMDGESVRTGLADGFVLVECDFSVVGGSMGLVHGEKVVRAFDRATQRGLPVVVVTRSGGARMQEGMLSLIQLSRTAAAVRRHQLAGQLSIAVHRSPTTGGVFASYGSLTDLRIAETGAMIGFAGPRVVEQTIGRQVDGHSHSAATALEAHIVDAVVDPDGVLDWVLGALGHVAHPLRAPRPPVPTRQPPPPEQPIDPAWAAVLTARQLGRASGIQVAAAATTSWTELGEGTDPALRVALVTADGQRAVAIAMDRYAEDGGAPGPAGYALACRGAELAGRLGIPVLTFVDTPGADVSPEAENAGIAREIARTHALLATVPVPTVSVCVGEGGSGGAQAFSAADRLLIQEGAIFSVIGPEGAAAILERDASKAAQVAPLLRLTSSDLVRFGIADQVVPDAVEATVEALHEALRSAVVGDRAKRLDAATATWLRGDERPLG